MFLTQVSHFFKGIEMKFKKMLFPLIVCPAWIPELNSVKHGPEGKAAPCFPWSPSGTGVGVELGRRYPSHLPSRVYAVSVSKTLQESWCCLWS